ncbi:VWA domain-containing protein [Nocardioides sp. GY 10113]|uniref:VWA domain-containing protein n=1 Tax=Nocardioides sp. GY 10113 TaxID=2569761 RepID=UPI0010A87549|nr:VWA domain-containing protein [Nocardioides sp. GY 10113]TIC87462.1 VWA domain-containing protein [Nocardioides sp. GY 10113]
MGYLLKRAVIAVVLSGIVAALFGYVPPAQAATDWRADVSDVADRPFSLTSVAHKQRISATLPAGSDKVRNALVDAVTTGATSAYRDQVRMVSEKTGRQTYFNDLKLAGWLAGRLRLKSNTAEADALTDLLMAGRLTAATAVHDAAAALRVPAEADEYSLVTLAGELSLTSQVTAGLDLLVGVEGVLVRGGRSAALRELRLAQSATARAEAALDKAYPVTAEVNFAYAWLHGVNALDHLGITPNSDIDGDGVPDELELRVGSSPLAADSDGDGLTDLFEIDALFGFSLPADTDTDDDGLADGKEDLDGDGLTALQEQTLGTKPTEPDTDNDGLSDKEEGPLGTSPVKADTDDDGLLDGIEPAMSTSPTDADTDDDGVLDGDEQLQQQVHGVDGITATLVGTGDLVSTFNVTEVTTDARMIGAGGQVGPAYDFSLSPPAYEGFAQAELSIPFDPTAIGDTDPADLRLFYFDPELRVWGPATADQEVDLQASVVRATVTHFSTYAIFDIKNWGEIWTAQDNPCRTRGDGGGGTDIVLLDLALVLDSSGSMDWNDPDGLRRSAAKNFVDALLPEDRAAVVDFDDSAYVTQGLTTDHDAVKAAIDQIDDVGGTNIGAGVSLANSILINNGDPARARMAILLTDGEGSYSSSLTEQARTAGIAIYTIGLGASVDSALLSDIATQTGGKYHHVDTAEELPEVFRRISNDTGGGDPRASVDTDGDGLSDCIEIEGAQDSTGHRYTSDPTLPDTDGDGLTDAEEVGEARSIGEVFLGWEMAGVSDLLERDEPIYSVISDPYLEDSDSDGLIDPADIELELDAFNSDVDGDGLSDGDEAGTIGSNPEAHDTDGDGYDDSYENGHRDDQGLDPLFYDKTVSTWTYAKDFLQGFIAGDMWRGDSLAWLAGNLSSGGLSFIPVYGWGLGAIADLRDAIGSVAHADWVGAGLSLVGILPYAGDAVSIPGKAVRFADNAPELADETVTFIAKIDGNIAPDAIKIDTVKKILGPTWDDLTDAGFTDDALLQLSKGRGDLDEVAAAMKGCARSGRAIALAAAEACALHVPGAKAGDFATGKAGEEWLEGYLEAGAKGEEKQVWRTTKDFIGKGRFFDVLVDGVAHESKVGRVKWSTAIEVQIKKDAWLVQQSGNGVTKAHWHFFASSSSNTIGPDDKVLELLKANGITYSIHPS